MQRRKKKDNRGTTLIELVLYIAISSILLVEMAGIISQVIYNQTRIQIIAREDENGRTAMRLISQSIQEAATIVSPNYINATASTVDLTDNSGNDVKYILSNGIIYKQINNGTQNAITSNDVYIKNLTFTVETEAGISPSMNIKLDIQQTSTNALNLSHYETTSAQRKF